MKKVSTAATKQSRNISRDAHLIATCEEMCLFEVPARVRLGFIVRAAIHVGYCYGSIGYRGPARIRNRSDNVPVHCLSHRQSRE